MKTTSFRLLIAIFLAGLCTGLLAQEQNTFAEISVAGPGKNTVKRTEYIALVVEGPNLSFESTAVPISNVVAYVNELLKTKNVSYIGLYVREGAKYGDLVLAVDTLRKTNAKSIGISISQLPPGREP